VAPAFASFEVKNLTYSAELNSFRAMHVDRLATDRELAERRNAAEIDLAQRRFDHDRELADKKAASDEVLAERRFQYELDLSTAKRRMEIAEQALTDFYEAREIITEARSPGGFVGEGRSRQPERWESEGDSRLLDSYFRAAERFNAKAEFFSQFYARRYRFLALFGRDWLSAYDEIFKIRWEIIVAVRMLIDTYQNRDAGSLPKDRELWERVIGWRPLMGGDNIPIRIDRAVNIIEKLCLPVISEAGGKGLNNRGLG
jgi:hypothetical protein